MMDIHMKDTVGAIVTRHPALARVFEQKGVDYCCGGNKTLDDACREQRLESEAFLATLQESLSDADEKIVDAAAMSLTELADHIEQTHHAYLRSEFPRLDELSAKVASAHGDHDARLYKVRETFLALADELSSHMMKEEQILFPMIRQLDSSESVPDFHCGSLANPIHQMEAEHDDAGSALKKLRTLTDDYAAPEWACNTFRAMLHALVTFEGDLHQHIHKENNVLFPRAIDMERVKCA